MWIFTETGFISAVAHRDDQRFMMVRARDKQSLEELALMSQTEIEYTPSADYSWRVVVHKQDLYGFMENAISVADYDNFKNRVALTRGRRFVDALHHVWEIMHNVEDESAKKRWNRQVFEDELADEYTDKF
jgi:hypothetical protein